MKQTMQKLEWILNIKLEFVKRKQGETKYWLRMVATAVPESKEAAKDCGKKQKNFI